MPQDFWRLPKGVDEVLPPRARHLELLRRAVLDLFHLHGYDYIEPPIIEYLDALLVGNDLTLQTLQVADQVSGRTLGVRADITSQAARIDANSLSNSGAVGGATEDLTRRLCYAGPVVRANPQGVLESRVPLKAGAEIYGCSGVEADLEIMCLAIDSLKSAGVKGAVIELGHVGFVRHLVDELGLSENLRDRLFEAVRIKSESDIAAVIEKAKLSSAVSDSTNYNHATDQLCKLVRLMGSSAALDEARALFNDSASGKGSAGSSAASSSLVASSSLSDQKLLELVEQLDYCASRLQQLRPEIQVRFDLSAPVGFGYHHAMVFALYDPGHGRAVARGGRYDGIGEQFGDARPATGFDVNLKTLLGLPAVAERFEQQSSVEAVWVSRSASSSNEVDGLIEAVGKLRAQGMRVVQALKDSDTRPGDCTRELQHTSNGWELR